MSTIFGLQLLVAYILSVVASTIHQSLTHGAARLLIVSSFGQGKRSGDLGETEQLAFVQFMQNSSLVLSLPLAIFDVRRLTSLVVLYSRYCILIAIFGSCAAAWNAFNPEIIRGADNV